MKAAKLSSEQAQACIFELLIELQRMRFKVASLERQLAASNKQLKDAAGFLYAKSKKMESEARQ